MSIPLLILTLVNYGSNTFYVDDIVVTKAKEAPASLTFGELSVANGAGEAIESLAGVDAVDVSVAFNRIGAQFTYSRENGRKHILGHSRNTCQQNNTGSAGYVSNCHWGKGYFLAL